MCIWIHTAKAELLKDLVFLKLLNELQDRIAEDGLANHLTTTLADSIKESASRGSGGSTGSPLLQIRVRSVRVPPLASVVYILKNMHVLTLSDTVIVE